MEEVKTAAPTVSLAGLSKEDKEKEMARRREERKAVRGRATSWDSLLTARSGENSG